MGRTKVSISLTDDEIKRLDSLRGDMPRSDFVAHLIKKNKVPETMTDSRLISEFSKCATAIKAYVASDKDSDLRRLEIYTRVCDMTDMMKQAYGL